jgi:hypothetical protein
MRRNILEYLHDDKEVKDDEWVRYRRVGLGSRGNTRCQLAPWVHRVFSNDMFVSLRC